MSCTVDRERETASQRDRKTGRIKKKEKRIHTSGEQERPLEHADGKRSLQKVIL